MSVMYLMDMKKYEEAETYTASVLSRLNCRPQEKFLILAVFMILICILLYCVLSDMLKKSNTEMELAFLQKQKQLKQEQDYSLQVRRQIFRSKLYRDVRTSNYSWNKENMSRLILRSEI